VSDTPDHWDTKEAIRIVRRHSNHELTQRQLQSWHRSGVISADRFAAKNKRLYSFNSIRRLCIVATLLKAKFPAQRLRTVVHNIENAAKRMGKSWDMLRLVTDGESVFVIDGDKAINAIGGQLVSLVLLGDLEREAQAVCRASARRSVASAGTNQRSTARQRPGR
jgi:DNA-binding transcriptional MerR regulator